MNHIEIYSVRGEVIGTFKGESGIPCRGDTLIIDGGSYRVASRKWTPMGDDTLVAQLIVYRIIGDN